MRKNGKAGGSGWRKIIPLKKVYGSSFINKDSDVPSVYYDEAVDEALCYGWIDSKPNKRDEGEGSRKS